MILNEWEPYFEPHILSRGKTYFDHRLVRDLKIGEDEISAVVKGTEPYRVRIRLNKRSVAGLSCTCPYADGGYACKHIAAVLYAAEAVPDHPAG